MSSNIVVMGGARRHQRNDKGDDNNSNSSVESADDESDYSNWSLIPEPVFIKILQHLTTADTLRAGQCCHRWNLISKDDYLWKKIFQRDFKVAPNIGLKPGMS